MRYHNISRRKFLKAAAAIAFAAGTKTVPDLKPLPSYSLESEQTVLGGLLLDNTAWGKIADVLDDGDFYRADHRQIYRHIVALIRDKKPADLITVVESLERSVKLEDVGGQAYLGSLAFNCPSARNIRRYAEIVHERAAIRKRTERA
jgi:replicative DNA helicase